MMEWISVNDRLPEHGQTIMLYDAMFDRVDIWIVDKDPNLIDADYTHWMPLPKAPE